MRVSQLILLLQKRMLDTGQDPWVENTRGISLDEDSFLLDVINRSTGEMCLQVSETGGADYFKGGDS
jgi:hypothetical protein